MFSYTQISNCPFSERIVEYIYDEATVKEKKEFEAHLLNCLTCAEEIAGFGLVRSSINEWRKEELFVQNLPSPEISALRPIVGTSEKNSWFDNFRKLFPISPIWAAGFAVIVICFGFALMFFNSSKQEIAVNSNKISEIVPVSPLRSNNTENLSKDEKAVVNKNFENNAKTSHKIQTIEPNNIIQTKTTNKTQQPKPKTVQQNTENSVARNELNKPKKTGNFQKNDAPTLADSSDDEDKSLRLAELFDEIGTD